MGLPPRTVGRINRFHHAVRMAMRDDARLSAVAAACGYFDQAHLTRDFRLLSGEPPTRLLARLSDSSKTGRSTAR